LADHPRSQLARALCYDVPAALERTLFPYTTLFRSINHEHQKTLTLQRALIEAERLRREGMHRLAEATLEAARAQNELADLEFEFAKGERSISRFNDQLADTIRLLEQIGGIGSALGSVLGLVSGNFANARGPLGLLLNSEVRRKDEKTGEIIASRLGDELRN